MWIAIKAEDGTVARVPQESFELVWRELGWTEIADSAIIATEALGVDVEDVTKLSKSDLVAVATRHGVPLTGHETKDELVGVIESVTPERAT